MYEIKFDLEAVEPEGGDSQVVSVCKWAIRHYAMLMYEAPTQAAKEEIHEDMGEYVFDAIQILEDRGVL